MRNTWYLASSEPFGVWRNTKPYIFFFFQLCYFFKICSLIIISVPNQRCCPWEQTWYSNSPLLQQQAQNKKKKKASHSEIKTTKRKKETERKKERVCVCVRERERERERERTKAQIIINAAIVRGCMTTSMMSKLVPHP